MVRRASSAQAMQQKDGGGDRMAGELAGGMRRWSITAALARMVGRRWLSSWRGERP
ncbi:hypothetical protein Scep_022854 [Stephania cephalantha]|uniref:Uncharacterized protein n=1 Tax=Stephania cephalantha TaxID=152367 RepID=A0AAP0F8Q2_9MAGN